MLKAATSNNAPSSPTSSTPSSSMSRPTLHSSLTYPYTGPNNTAASNDTMTPSTMSSETQQPSSSTTNDTINTPVKTTYAFQRPFVNEPTVIHSFVSSSQALSPSASRAPYSRNPHTSPNPHIYPRTSHRQIFASSGTFASPPCSSRIGVGLQAGADSNLPLSHSHSPQSNQQQQPQQAKEKEEEEQQQQQQQQQTQESDKTYTSSSVFLPFLNALTVASTSNSARQLDQAKIERKDSYFTRMERNMLQCDDDLPSPDYLNLTSALQTNFGSTSRNSELLSLQTSSDLPHASHIRSSRYQTPELVAMENGSDPTRLSLPTLTTPDNKNNKNNVINSDDSRKLDTPLLDLQEQSYAITPASTSSLSLSPVSIRVKGQHEQSLIANESAIGLRKIKEVEEEKRLELPTSPGGLDQRYWNQSTESEDEIDQVENQEDELHGSHPHLDLSNQEKIIDGTVIQQRKVRFMAEVQIIPSTRNGCDEDDEDNLTLINDSDEDSYDGSGSDNDNSDSNNSIVPSLKPSLDEWKALRVVESILQVQDEQILNVDTTCTQTITNISTSDPNQELISSEPSTLSLLSSPVLVCGSDSRIVEEVPSSSMLSLPCSPSSVVVTTVTTSPTSVDSPAITPIKGTLKVTPPNILTVSSTAKSDESNYDQCISPRTIELNSVRSQLHYWTETATLLKDQEQELKLHIDQLVQVMADVIEKCQQTEFELFECRKELDKERTLGFASIQEAALSNREKQMLEIELDESQKAIKTLRRVYDQQQIEFRQECEMSLQRANELSQANDQIQELQKQMNFMKEQKEMKDKEMCRLPCLDVQDPPLVQVQREDCIDAVGTLEDEDFNMNRRMGDEAEAIKTQLLTLQQQQPHETETKVALSTSKLAMESLSATVIAPPMLLFETTDDKALDVQPVSPFIPTNHANTSRLPTRCSVFSLRYFIMIMILAGLSILITLIVSYSDHQHQYHFRRLFIHFLDNSSVSFTESLLTLSRESVNYYTFCLQPLAKDMMQWARITVPGSVSEWKTLSLELAALVEEIEVSVMIGKKGLSLIRAWS
ncbi:hypothetical protein FBU30_005322 [Linnemannia zychae]|nr:hypothetical protein FBU30_005322 [Linnemannia zychae]